MKYVVIFLMGGISAAFGYMMGYWHGKRTQSLKRIIGGSLK